MAFQDTLKDATERWYEGLITADEAMQIIYKAVHDAEDVEQALEDYFGPEPDVDGSI